MCFFCRGAPQWGTSTQGYHQRGSDGDREDSGNRVSTYVHVQKMVKELSGSQNRQNGFLVNIQQGYG